MSDFVTSFKEFRATARVSSWGDSGSGKSRLIMSMPRRTGVFPLEKNSRTSLQDLLDLEPDPDNVLVIPKYDFMHVDVPDDVVNMQDLEAYYKKLCMEADAYAAKHGTAPSYPNKKLLYKSTEESALQQHYVDYIDKLKSTARGIVQQKGVMSIAVDSGTEMYDAFCVSVLGRRPRFGDAATDLSPIHTEIKMFLNNFASLNVLVTHHPKLEFKSVQTKSGKSAAAPTGNNLADGWKKMSFNTNIEVEHMRVTSEADLTMLKLVWYRKDAKMGDYALLIKKVHGAMSRLPKSKDGQGVLLNHEINFANLVFRCYPNTDLVNDWGYTEEEVERFVISPEDYYV